MTDFTGDSVIGDATTGSSRLDVDRQWWGEPDPVEVFAAGLELALRQLRIEVAGLRAERDGLRLEVEGLRAKLMLAHEQIASREGLDDTVRQLQAAVGRLTTGQAGGIGLAAPVYGQPSTTTPVVAPFETPQPPVIVLPPAPAPVEPVAPAPTPTPELSAIDQLKAMGVWPRAEGDRAFEPAVAAPPPPPPPPPPPLAPAPAPEVREPATKEPVVNWDKMSTRRTPVLLDDEHARFDVPDNLDDAKKKKSKLRLVVTGLTVIVGGFMVLVVLAVSVGPRFLPYQTYFVRSGSMAPTIETGAMVVLTKADAEKLGPGDIITFNNPDDDAIKVTHRIVEIESTDQGRVFVTKGDANGDVDSWRVPASGTGWKYWFNIPMIGFVFGYLGTPQARMALLIIPAAVLGLLALLDIWKPKDKRKK